MKANIVFYCIALPSLMALITGVPLSPGEGEGGGGVVSDPVTPPPSSPVSAAEEEMDYFSEDDYEEIVEEEDTPPPAHPPISDHLPQFTVSLPDQNLLCFSIEGFELFTYNLLSTPQLQVNSFLNITRTAEGVWVRGGTDLGFLMKIRDRRVKNGQRVFKIKVYGAEKKTEIAGFGQVDMQGGAVAFTVDREGHSNIESSEATREQIIVAMESPKVKVWGVSGDGVTYNVYVEELSGLLDIPTHGILGQFLRPGVRIDVESGQLHLGPDRDPIPVELAPVWDGVHDDGYRGRQCWYPLEQESQSVLEGEPYDYVTEHLLSHKYRHSQFDPKSQL